MITQMYFPGDPLFALDPIYQSIVDQKARDRLVATYDHDVTQHEWATGYRWDIVLTGGHRTPMEDDGGATPMSTLTATPGQTVGPFFGYALPFDRRQRAGAARLTRRDPAARHGERRCRRAGARRAARDLAGRRATGRSPQARSLRRDGWTFTGLGRASTDDDGRYIFTTVRPARPQPGTAPFIAVTVFARGLLNRLFTRAYLPGDAESWRRPVAGFAARPDAARPWSRSRDEHGLRFDIRLQGEGETVFLRYPGH